MIDFFPQPERPLCDIEFYLSCCLTYEEFLARDCEDSCVVCAVSDYYSERD